MCVCVWGGEENEEAKTAKTEPGLLIHNPINKWKTKSAWKGEENKSLQHFSSTKGTRQHSLRRDFPWSWGAYLNWICCWLKCIGPISQLLITRSWAQMDESSERTLSLILSPLMCYGILGCRRGKKGDCRHRWPFRPSSVYTQNFAHAHTHAQRFIQEAFVTVGSGANWFHAWLKNEIKNNRKV